MKIIGKWDSIIREKREGTRKHLKDVLCDRNLWMEMFQIRRKKRETGKTEAAQREGYVHRQPPHPIKLKNRIIVKFTAGVQVPIQKQILAF